MRRHATQGIDIKYIHREDRTGYKAGALDEGLQGRAAGNFVAIFDADFIPKPDFLRATRSTTSPTTRSRWCRRAGGTSTRTTRC